MSDEFQLPPGMIPGVIQPPPPAFNVDDIPFMVCDRLGCENTTFEEKTMIKRIPRLLTGAPKDQLSVLGVFACAKCGNVNEIFKTRQ